MRFPFEVWWACRDRPFFAASQFVIVEEASEMDALARVMATVPDGPFLHAGGCCYISDCRPMPLGWGEPR